MSPRSINIFIFAFLFWNMSSSVAFTGASAPGGNPSKLRPFDPQLKPSTSLDSVALQTLENGKPVKTRHHRDSHRVLVVQDINAPLDVVFGRILDYGNYYKMAPHTLESEVYKRTSDSFSQTVFSRIRAGMRGFSMNMFVKATFHPVHNSVTWTLDYEKESDLEDGCGHWYVAEHPQNPARSRLFYSVDMVMGPKIPKFVGNYINKKAASDATAWVKKFSEEHAKELFAR
eukprot:scaffold1194_cov127-Cylindrotheca_fusiformis.AAC.21